MTGAKVLETGVEAAQILPKETEDVLIRAINQKNHESPFFNLRNVVRLIAQAAVEAEGNSRKS